MAMHACEMSHACEINYVPAAMSVASCKMWRMTGRGVPVEMSCSLPSSIAARSVPPSQYSCGTGGTAVQQYICINFVLRGQDQE